jgi:hypothetical protein
MIIAGQIDPKTAGLLLYALQTASFNLKKTRFEPRIRTVVLNPGDVADSVLDADLWADEDEEDEQEPDEEETEEAETEDDDELEGGEELQVPTQKTARRWKAKTRSPPESSPAPHLRASSDATSTASRLPNRVATLPPMNPKLSTSPASFAASPSTCARSVGEGMPHPCVFPTQVEKFIFDKLKLRKIFAIWIGGSYCTISVSVVDSLVEPAVAVTLSV